MGACISQQQTVVSDSFTEQQLRQFMSCFEVPMPYEDLFKAFPLFETMEQLTNIDFSQFKVIMTSYSGPESEMWNDVETWQDKLSNYNHPNIMTLHGFYVKRLAKLVPSLEITLFIDIPLKSLIYHEKLAQKKPLSDDEIWFFLDCMLQALAHLQSKKTYVEFLSMENIYQVMTPFKQVVYKLGDRTIKPSSQSTLSIMIDKGNDYDFIKEFKKNLFLTPIQLENIKIRNKFPVENHYKANVFQLGLIALQARTVNSISEIYNWQTYKIGIELEQRLDKLKRADDSNELKQFLSKMLIINEEQRLDAIEMNNECSRFFMIMGKQRLLDVNEQDTFIFDGNRNIIINSLNSPRRQGITDDLSFKRITDQSMELNDQVIYDQLQENQNQDRNKFLIEQKKKKQQQQQQVTQQLDEFKYGVKKVYTNNFYYDGDLLNNKRHGYGKFYSNKDELLIEGQWKNDYPQGDITIYNPKGYQIQENEQYSYQNLNRKDWIKYNGHCEKGAKHGQGKLLFNDETYFIGMFKNDKANGVGMFQYGPQKIHGNWKDNQYIQK